MEIPRHSSAPADAPWHVSRKYAWIVFAVTFCLLLSDYMSRQVLNAVFPHHKAEWMLTAFSPRKQNITLYLGHLDQQRDLLDQLGTHSCGKGCLYIKRLSDVHLPTLRKLVTSSVALTRKSQAS